jgi:outer membrane protein
MINLKKLGVTGALGAFGLAAFVGGVAVNTKDVAAAEAGDWRIGMRAVAVLINEPSANDRVGDDRDGGALGNILGNVSISDDYLPEVDIAYFITDNFAIETIGGFTHHQISYGSATIGNFQLGDIDLGEVSALPVTFTLQYHLTGGQFGVLPDGYWVQPYVGVSGGRIFFFDKSVPRFAQTAFANSHVVDMDYSNEWTYGFQVGSNFDIGNGWAINLDVKYQQISFDASVDAVFASGVFGFGENDLRLDPVILGVGVNYTF